MAQSLRAKRSNPEMRQRAGLLRRCAPRNDERANEAIRLWVLTLAHALPCYIAGMRQPLRLHPDSLCSAVTRIEVEVARPHAGGLQLTYFVGGKIGDVRLPPVVTAARADELWRHTCFEAFIGASASAAYHEFNFAPSTQWAAYRFSGYRSGMQVATKMRAPRIDVQAASESYILQASLELDWLSRLPGDARWRLGLSAVIEETSGRQSYWALAHPPGKADFHHSDCFAHELPPA
jgi:hypothetical protein